MTEESLSVACPPKLYLSTEACGEDGAKEGRLSVVGCRLSVVGCLPAEALPVDRSLWRRWSVGGSVSCPPELYLSTEASGEGGAQEGRLSKKKELTVDPYSS